MVNEQQESIASTIKYGFFDSTNFNRTYNAQDISWTHNGIISQGIFDYFYKDDGSKTNIDHFNITIIKATNGNFTVEMGIGKAYYCNLWIYNSGNISIGQVYSDSSNPRFASIYLKINKSVIYKSDTEITVNDVIEPKIIQGSAAASPSAPTITGETDVFYMPIAHLKIPANTTDPSKITIVSAATSSSVSIDGVTFSTTPKISSLIGTVNLTNLTDEGEWGVAGGEYDKLKDTISNEYELWLKNNIKDKNFSNSPAGLVADYYSRATVVKNYKKSEVINVYLKSAKKNLSGKTVTFHNNTYPQYKDITAQFSISETTPEVTVVLEHIGNYTIKENFKEKEFTIDIPYFGEFYKTIDIGYGDGDVFGYMVNIANISDVRYPKNYVYNQNFLCVNYEFPATKIDWNTGKIDSNFEEWADAYFLPHPVIIDSNGKEIYELDEDNLAKAKNISTGEWVATSSINMRANGYNMMQAFPKVYTARFIYNGYAYFYLSKVKIDDRFKCYAHINCNGEEIEKFYRSIYPGSFTRDSGKLMSISGETPSRFGMSSCSRLSAGDYYDSYGKESSSSYKDTGSLATAQHMARSNNPSKNIWNIEGISDLNLIKDYVVLLTKSFRTFETMGATTYSRKPLKNGLMDSFGQFYSNGKMVYDYTKSKGNDLKCNVNTDIQRYCKFLGIERLHSEMLRYCLGAWIIAKSGIAYKKDPQDSSLRTNNPGWAHYNSGFMTKNTHGTQDGTKVTDWKNYGYFGVSWSVPNDNYKYLTNPDEHINEDYATLDYKTDQSIRSAKIRPFNGWQYRYRIAVIYDEDHYGNIDGGISKSIPESVDIKNAITKNSSISHNITSVNYGPQTEYDQAIKIQHSSISITPDANDGAILEYSNEFGFIFTSDSKILYQAFGAQQMIKGNNGEGYSAALDPAHFTVLAAGAYNGKWDNPYISRTGQSRLYPGNMWSGAQYIQTYNLFNYIQERALISTGISGSELTVSSNRKRSSWGNAYDRGYILEDNDGKTKYNVFYFLAALTCRPEASVANN